MKKRKIQSLILNLLLFLLALFFAKGPLYSESTLFSRVVSVTFLGISALYLMKTLLIRSKGSNFYYYWLLLLVLIIVSFYLTGLFPNSSKHLPMFYGSLIAILSFFPFYYFSRNGFLKEKQLVLFFIFLLPIIIAKYYYTELLILAERSFSVMGITNNSGYYFTVLIPFLFLFKKKNIWSYLFLFILMFYIISSAKRGAILVGVVGVLCFLYFQLRTANKKEVFITLVLVLVAAVALAYYGYEFIQNNEYLLNRLNATSSGDSSGRDVIYRSIFNSWFDTPSLFNFIFGFGFAASLELSTTGHVAHNDWLELLSNFGLIGVTLYSLLLYSLYTFMRSPFLTLEKKMLLGTILLMWILTSLFSMVYTSETTALYSLLLAYILGSEKRNRHKTSYIYYNKQN